MEGTKEMTSNTSKNTAAALAPSNSTAAASAPHNHQQEEAVVVPSPTGVKGQAVRNTTKPRPQQEVALECPRCSSKNTKFCYYNNYNLDQPRYFCKNCRRYWTQGGTLHVVPIGGGCRRNKRASGSSSSSSTSSTAASSTAATSAVMKSTVKTRLMLTAASTKSMPHSPTTGLLPSDKLPTFTPVSSVLDVAMEEQQSLLAFTPLSLSNNQAPELAPGGSDLGFLPFTPLYLSDNQAAELAPGGSDMTPTFLDMLTGGYFDAGSSSYYYDGGLSMGGGSNAMDMSFLLPGMCPSATDPMQTQLLEGIDDVAGELQWTSAELDSYFNNDGGYAAGPAAGVEQQQRVVLVGDQQEEDDNKAKGAEG